MTIAGGDGINGGDETYEGLLQVAHSGGYSSAGCSSY